MDFNSLTSPISGGGHTKSFSAYGCSSINNVKSGSVPPSIKKEKPGTTERDEALAIAKRIRQEQDSKRREMLAAQNGLKLKDAIDQAAKMQNGVKPDVSGVKEQTLDNNNTTNIQKKKPAASKVMSDEEVKESLKKANELNQSEAVKSLGTDASADDIMNALIGSIF